MIKLEKLLKEVTNAAGVNSGAIGGQNNPKAIILAGAPGAGKGYVKFKGKRFDYSVMQKGKGPWEKPAYAAEKNIKTK